MNAVLYGPTVLTGSFSSLPSPSSSLYFSLLGCGEAGTWQEEGGKDGSSAQCKSLPPGKPALDARPHGPLTCCLPWFMAAGGPQPLQTPLLSLLYFRSHSLQDCEEPHTLQHRLEHPKRNSSHMLSYSTDVLTSTASYTVSTRINTTINISALQHRVLQSHHMSVRLGLLLDGSAFDCVWITISHGVSAVEPSVKLHRGINGSALSSEVMFLFSHGLRAIRGRHISADSTHCSVSTLQ